MTDFRPGDRVRMKYLNGYATGEITIVTDLTCKVIFDGDFDLSYDYYMKSDLEKIEKKKEDDSKR